MTDQRRAPSTRWTGRARGDSGPPLDNDTVVFRLVTLVAAAALTVVLLPAIVAGVLLAGVWSWHGWSPWWLLPIAVAPWGLVALLVGDPVGIAALAVSDLVTAGGVEPELWGRAVVATSPVAVTLGSLTAAAVVAWQRLRAPSWRDSRRRQDERRALRRSRASARRVASTVLSSKGEVLIGVDETTGRPAGIPARMLGRHTLVVGSTGSGKTTTATRLAAATLDQGGGLIVVDLKGDPDTITTWSQAADEREIASHVWSLDADTVYDPLAAGGVAERTRKVMALADWTEPYYRDQAEQLLQLTLRTLEEVGERPTLARLHTTLTPDGLATLQQRSDGPAGGELARETTSMTPGRLSALESVRTKLALLTQAEFGPQLDPDLARGRPSIDLAAALEAGEIVVVSLDELSYGHIAARMAEVVLTDVAAAAGARLRRDRPRTGMVWVDEFSAMRPGPLASLFARVRSANLALLLSTQEVSDLAREEPTFRAAVATNVATLLAHRVHDPESAEWISQLIGTRAGWAETSQVEAISRLGAEAAAGGATGLGTIREVEQYLVHPNEVKSLPDHHAYLARLDQPADGSRARRVRVIPLARPVTPLEHTTTAEQRPPTRRQSPTVATTNDGPVEETSRIPVDTEKQWDVALVPEGTSMTYHELPGEEW